MASKETWENWRSINHNKGSDEEIVSMIDDVVQVTNLLEKIYGVEGSLMVRRSLITEWIGLRSIADARGLKDYSYPGK